MKMKCKAIEVIKESGKIVFESDDFVELYENEDGKTVTIWIGLYKTDFPKSDIELKIKF